MKSHCRKGFRGDFIAFLALPSFYLKLPGNCADNERNPVNVPSPFKLRRNVYSLVISTILYVLEM